MPSPKRNKETHALLAALAHPMRRRILRALPPKGESCPGELAKRLDVPLDKVSYHFKVLARGGAVKLVRTEEVGGSMKHVYRSSLKSHWARELLEEGEGERPAADS